MAYPVPLSVATATLPASSTSWTIATPAASALPGSGPEPRACPPEIVSATLCHAPAASS